MLSKFIRKDKQFIFNFAAVLGVGFTMVSTIRDTTRACKLTNDKMTLEEKIKKTWKCYIPSTTIAISTITCILYSDYLSQQKKLSLLSALMSIQSNYKNLRESVDEVCDEDTKDKLRNKIVKSKIDKETFKERTGTKLFYEEYSGRFIEKSIDQIIEAEAALNKQIFRTGLASLNDFYEYLGIEGTNEGEYLGWASEVDSGYFGSQTTSPLVDFIHSKMIDDDGIEYYFIGFTNQPEINYDIF